MHLNSFNIIKELLNVKYVTFHTLIMITGINWGPK